MHEHYLSHQAVDTDHGIIVGVTATSGDVHDSAPFLDLAEAVRMTFPIQAVTADAAYPIGSYTAGTSAFLCGHKRNLTVPPWNSPAKDSHLTRQKMRISAHGASS